MKKITLVLGIILASLVTSQSLASVEDFKEMITEAQQIQFDLHQVVLEKVEAPKEAFQFESEWRNPQQVLGNESSQEMVVTINMNIALAK